LCGSLFNSAHTHCAFRREWRAASQIWSVN